MTRRTGTIAVVLFAAGALAAILLLTASLRERLYQEHLAAARAALASSAASLERAERLGVPLDEMVGLEELLESRAAARNGLRAVRVLDAGGRILWQDGRRALPAASTLEVPIGTAGRLQAQFIAPSDAVMLLRVAAMLLAIAVVLAFPLLELCRLADLAEEDFPARYLERQLLRIRNRDLRLTWRLAGVRDDVRLHFLRDQVLLLDEQYRRVVRLVGSLRRTEPDAGRRARMRALLDELRRRFRFAEESPVDRSVWIGQGTARAFAVLTLLLANLSVGGGGSSPYSPGAAPYSAPLALSLWSAGLLLGAAVSMRWPLRLLSGLAISVVTNLLMMQSAEWSELFAHLAGGLATALAAGAALDAAQGNPRRIMVALLVAASIVGPALGLAATAALSPFGHLAWQYGAAACLALLTGVWLCYRLPEGMGIGGLSRIARIRLSRAALAGFSKAARVRFGLEPVLAGIAWSAAIMAFVAQASANREEALRLVVLELPGLYLLAGRRAAVPRALAVILAAVCGAWLLRLAWPAALPTLRPELVSALGAACLAGAFAVLHDHRGAPRRMLSGLAAGALLMLTAVALVGRMSPRAALPLELWAALLAVSIGLLWPQAARRAARKAVSRALSRATRSEPG